MFSQNFGTFLGGDPFEKLSIFSPVTFIIQFLKKWFDNFDRFKQVFDTDYIPIEVF